MRAAASTRRSSPARTTRSPPPTARAGSSPTSGARSGASSRDGIRLFLIDPHWGVEDERRPRAHRLRRRGPRPQPRRRGACRPNVLKAAAAARRAARRGRHARGERDVWLCHTVCELGADEDGRLARRGPRRSSTSNRGEVVILFIEPYVPPARDRRQVFQRRPAWIATSSTLERDEPLPTLGELVRDEPAGDRAHRERRRRHDRPGTSTASRSSRTRRSARRRSTQLSCELERGDADSPILMLNHWADLVPAAPRGQRALPCTERVVLAARSRVRAQARGLPVELDRDRPLRPGRADRGRVDDLNAERVQALRRSPAPWADSVGRMRVLYGVNGEGHGPRHALAGRHRRICSSATTSAWSTSGAALRHLERQAPAGGRGLRPDLRHGRRTDPALADGDPERAPRAPRAARDDPPLDGGRPRMAAGRRDHRLRAAVRGLRALDADAAAGRGQHQHDRPLPPRPRDHRASSATTS